MNDEDFSIQDLCDQTGMSRRTIHFYIQQQILPPPSGSGLGARYQAVHLLRLRLIPILRQQGLRLDEIRQKFNEFSPEQLENLAATAPQSLPTAELPSAPPPGQAFQGQSYILYPLPEGVALWVPANLSAETRQKVYQLLQAAQQIF